MRSVLGGSRLWFSVAAALLVAVAATGVAQQTTEKIVDQTYARSYTKGAERAKWIAKQFGGMECDPSYVRSPGTISEEVGTPLGFTCAFSKYAGLDFVGIPLSKATGNAPLLLVVPPKIKLRGVVVFLVGGPGEKFIAPPIENPANQVIFELARSGYAVSYIGYSGTRYGTVYPSPDLPMATSQVTRYLTFLKRSMPDLPISLMGASAGAHPAYFAGRKMNGVRTILVSPPLSVPALYYALSISRNAHEARWWKSPRSVRVRPDWQGGKADWSLWEFVSVPNQDQIKNFFGPTYDLGLAEVMANYPKNPGVKIDIIIGTADSRIGVHEAARLATQHKGLCFRLISGSDHSVATSTQARLIIRALATSIKSHGLNCASFGALAKL